MRWHQPCQGSKPWQGFPLSEGNFLFVPRLATNGSPHQHGITTAPKRMLKKLFKNLLTVVIVLLLLYPITFLMKKQEEQQKTSIADLRSFDPQRVTSFRIYPRVIKPVGESITFNISESIISEFFQALKDISSYSPNHDTAKKEENWYLEVTAEGDVFQIGFYIPYGKGNIAVGEFDGGGEFQSRQLYQWYQTYSHRWLTPEGTPPVPQL